MHCHHFHHHHIRLGSDNDHDSEIRYHDHYHYHQRYHLFTSITTTRFQPNETVFILCLVKPSSCQSFSEDHV
jgi:hypothetical protein